MGQTATLTGNGGAYYLWNWSNPSSTTLAISPSITTQYTLYGTDVNGCSNSTTITQQVTSCTSLNTAHLISRDNVIKVHPNPTSTNLILEISELNEIRPTTKLQLMNCLGEVLFSNAILENKTINIDMYNFEAGIYVLSVFENNKLIKTQKIIKQ